MEAESAGPGTFRARFGLRAAHPGRFLPYQLGRSSGGGPSFRNPQFDRRRTRDSSLRDRAIAWVVGPGLV